MDMQQLQSLDVKNLVSKIVDKRNFNKDQRIAACGQLQEALTHASDISNIGCDWKLILEELLYCLASRQQLEVKRSVTQCLGVLGCIMFSRYNEYLKIILDEAKSIPDKYEDGKALVLEAIPSSLNLIGSFGWQSRLKPQDIEAIMNAMKNWLGVNDSPVVLIPLLDTCLAISKYFPAVFKKSFDDIVDFTLGWYIEPEQPNEVVAKCHQMLTELRPFWHDAIPAAVTLMTQFLDDANAYIEDIKETESKPEDILVKTAAILRALITMLKVIHFPQMNPLVTNFAEKIFGRIIRQLTHLADVYLVSVGAVFGHMAEVLWIVLKISSRPDTLITAMRALQMMLEHPSVSDRTVSKLLGYHGKIIDSTAPDVVVEIVDYIIGDKGFFQCLLPRSQEVLQAYGIVLGKLLAPRNLSTLQVAYRHVRKDVLLCFDMLKADQKTAYCNNLIIERKLIVYFNALYSLGIVKNSLIAMVGLSPSLFTFLMDETPITEKWFITNHPGCHYALIYVVKAHSEKHDNFIANSSLLVNKNSLTLMAEAATAKHTSKIFQAVAKLLTLDDFLWTDTRNLLIDWIYGMVFTLSADVLQQIRNKQETVEMRAALLDSFVRHSLPKKTPLDNKTAAAQISHRVRHFTLLRRLSVFSLVESEGPKAIADFVKRVLKSDHLNSQDKIIGIWQATPPVLFISNGLTEHAQDLMEFGQQKVTKSSFTAEHFKMIADFLLYSSVPTYCLHGIDDGNWMFDTASLVYIDAMGDKNTNTDSISKWRWIFAQMAQYCIDNRLKTPLGKPLDTFLAFENEIRRLASDALSRKAVPTTGKNKDETSKAMFVTRGKRGVGEDDDETDVEIEREPSQLTNSEQWWRVRALLDTIEILDKMMSYACDGAIFQLSTVSQVSQQFFITNQASCTNWLSRLYLPMMAVAYTNNNFAQVVRLGGCALRDIEKRVVEKKDGTDERGEVDSGAHICISWMVKALIELGRPQVIMGLNAWVAKVYGKKYNWIKYAAEMASGRIEFALHGLEDCLRAENLSDNTQKTLRQLIITGLEVLRNPDEIDMFWRALQGNLEPKPDDLPDGFKELAWKRMKSLTTFESHFKNEPSLAVPWDIRSNLVFTELKLMDIVRDRFKDSRENKIDVVDLTRQLGEDARILMQGDTSLQTHARASALHLLASAVKDSRKPNHKQAVAANMIDPSFLFDWRNGPQLQRLAIAQQLSSWLQHTEVRENGGNSSLRIIGNEPAYYLSMARLARKTKNHRLAERYIKLHYTKRLPTLDNFQQNILQGLQGNWINGTADKENNTVINGVIPLPMQQRMYTYENLITTYGSSKMMWSFADKADSDHARLLVKGKAFSLLLNAVADEVDRLLLKGNLMFNGTPTVAPDALIGVLTEQLAHVNIEDSAMVSVGPTTKINNDPQQQKSYMLTKAIIQLARWLQVDSNLLSVAMSHSMRIAFHMFGVEQSRFPLLGPSGIINALAGAFLSTACKLSPQLAKAHLELGNWAFEAANGVQNEGGLSFLNEECETVRWQIKNACSSMNDSVVENLLQAVQSAASVNVIAGDCKAAAKNDISEQTCEILFGPRSVIQNIWKSANARQLTFCSCAIRSYFAYIAVCGHQTEMRAIGTVAATLRILHLLIKHHDALYPMIRYEILRTNELLWKDILPQLFARLNHPAHVVRETICIILERIAASAPHALCYPIIVGATQPIVIHSGDEGNGAMERSNFVEVIDEEEKKRIDKDRSLMFACCQRILIQMQKLFPELVKDVTEFVKELQRIDMLHEERWIFVLTNLDYEMNRRISQIADEMVITYGNPHLKEETVHEIISEKTAIFISPIYQILKDLFEKTCTSVPGTVNEKLFQETYSKTIRRALKTFQANKMEPSNAWAPFKQLLSHLNQRLSRRSSLAFQMADLSPHLSALTKTHIPLPGQEHKNFADVVMLERICKQTIILPTKTRPKKISFHGSDGKDHPFLFKGQEDLHLDERVMQLLRICNLMLSAKETDWPSYKAENYSVTPLSSRSGLIEWVEGATPIFQVYRKWQLRQTAGNVTNEGGNAVERPSGLFFKKLKLAFQTQNIPKRTIFERQNWPQPILKSVVEELISETPQNLLSRELWLRSGSSDTWFRVTERFARSTAVMSMLGSILGLGDRHLDNVLVNFELGHVVHVDYNVCFDKGRNLRVPETVPFRLTGNIVRALGPTEIEGTFRLSCENVLARLRANKEILLTMLDAFVYDPLVDWAAAQDDLGSKSLIAVATMIAVYGVDSLPETLYSMSRSLFILRIKEHSATWLQNRDCMRNALTSIIDILEKVTAQNEENELVESKKEQMNLLELKKITAERNLKEAIADHNSLMHSIRPLLRSFAHRDERFATYLHNYKESFSDPLMKGHKLLDDAGKNFTICIGLLRSVIESIPSIYDNLLALKEVMEQTELLRRDGTSLSEERGEGYGEKQKQNMHGKHVAKRVRMKLEGMIDVDSKRSETGKSDAYSLKHQLTPSEQVDLLIQQATDISNLALMYEGWTAWV